MNTKKPYWEIEEGWDPAGNCLNCGEAGRCLCSHPRKNRTTDNQLATEMNCKPEWITNVVIDEENHIVTFECGGRFWAKLSKNNQHVRKNTIRTDN